MKNKINALLAMLILLVIIFGILALNKPSNQNPEKICIENKKCFFVEIADTSEKRILGLSKRSSLEDDFGMLFVFNPEFQPRFWMKDMNFPIDIIWINNELKIIGIENSLEPCREDFCPVVYPNEKIKYVLEINSNLSNIYGFLVGDEIEIK